MPYKEVGDEIVQVLSKELFEGKFNEGDIKKWYSRLKSGFNSIEPQKLKKKEGRPDYFSYVDSSLLYPESNVVVGVDLPTLFVPEKKSKGTIMFVSQDPLRNSHDFYSSNEEPEIPQEERLIIGTPWGLHHPYYRTEKNIYYQLVREIVKLGYSVYYTDVRKDWIDCKEYQEQRYRVKDSSLVKRDNKILDIERRYTKPFKIVTFGVVAASTIAGKVVKLNLRKLEHSNNIVSFYHPSARASAWRSDFKKNGFIPNDTSNNSILQFILKWIV